MKKGEPKFQTFEAWQEKICSISKQHCSRECYFFDAEAEPACQLAFLVSNLNSLIDTLINYYESKTKGKKKKAKEPVKIKCARCGKEMEQRSWNSILCKECKHEDKKKKDRDYRRAKRKRERDQSRE